MIAIVTRRHALGSLAALLAARSLSAKSRISRNRVSTVTDELGKTQQDAIAVMQQYKLNVVELRRVPGSTKEFATMTDPELRRAMAELGAVKIKVSILHASVLKPEVIAAAGILSAPKISLQNADADSIAKNLPAVEAAKMQLLIGNASLVSQFPSKALGLDWDPVAAPDAYAAAGKGRVANLRVQIETEAGWRRKFEALDRDNYSGGVSLETTVEKSDDALHDLLRLVDSL
jgi:hypothetical protein